MCTFELTHNSQFCPIRTHSEQFFPHFGGLSGVCLRGGDKQSTALFAFPPSSSFSWPSWRSSMRRSLVLWSIGGQFLCHHPSCFVTIALPRRENGSGGWPFCVVVVCWPGLWISASLSYLFVLITDTILTNGMASSLLKPLSGCRQRHNTLQVVLPLNQSLLLNFQNK